MLCLYLSIIQAKNNNTKYLVSLLYSRQTKICNQKSSPFSVIECNFLYRFGYQKMFSNFIIDKMHKRCSANICNAHRELTVNYNHTSSAKASLVVFVSSGFHSQLKAQIKVFFTYFVHFALLTFIKHLLTPEFDIKKGTAYAVPFIIKLNMLCILEQVHLTCIFLIYNIICLAVFRL